jgi:hypothetical protein
VSTPPTIPIDPIAAVQKAKDLRAREPKAHEVLIGAIAELAKGERAELVLERADAEVLVHRLNNLAALVTKAKRGQKTADERADRIAQRCKDEVDKWLEWGQRIKLRLRVDVEQGQVEQEAPGG